MMRKFLSFLIGFVFLPFAACATSYAPGTIANVNSSSTCVNIYAYTNGDVAVWISCLASSSTTATPIGIVTSSTQSARGLVMVCPPQSPPTFPATELRLTASQSLYACLLGGSAISANVYTLKEN